MKVGCYWHICVALLYFRGHMSQAAALAGALVRLIYIDECRDGKISRPLGRTCLLFERNKASYSVYTSQAKKTRFVDIKLYERIFPKFSYEI